MSTSRSAIVLESTIEQARRVLVGIAGGSCSGKSTFAVALAEALRPLRTRVVSMDAHMLKEGGPSITLSTGETLPNNNHPLSTDNARALEEIESAEGDVVIVEGLMALHLDAVHERLDLKLFVELEEGARAARRIIRNLAKRPDQEAEWVARYYLECALPGHRAYVEPSRARADLIVRGDGDHERTAALVAHVVRASLGKASSG